MSVTELQDDVDAALNAAADRDVVSEMELTSELVRSDQSKSVGVDGFLGCMDSGEPDWAGTDTNVLCKVADDE